MDPIVAMRWSSNVDGCFFTSSCPNDQKFQCTLNLLLMGTKDWWNLVNNSYTLEQRAAVTWEQFSETFHTRYVPLVERKISAQEYLDLRQTTKSVMEITKMFNKRALFYPEFCYFIAGSDDVVLKHVKDGYSTVSVHPALQYLPELQDAARRREIEIEIQTRELRQTPVQS